MKNCILVCHSPSDNIGRPMNRLAKLQHSFLSAKACSGIVPVCPRTKDSVSAMTLALCDLPSELYHNISAAAHITKWKLSSNGAAKQHKLQKTRGSSAYDHKRCKVHKNTKLIVCYCCEQFLHWKGYWTIKRAQFMPNHCVLRKAKAASIASHLFCFTPEQPARVVVLRATSIYFI